MSISIWSNARLCSWMEDKLSKGGNYRRLKKGSKPEYGNSGPENFVHPPFKISGSAPATSIRRCSIARLYWEVTLHSNKTRRSATLFHHFDIVNSFWPVKLYSIFDQHLDLVVSIATPIVSELNKSIPCWKHKLPDRSLRDSLPFLSKEMPEICHSAVFCHPLLNGSSQNIPHMRYTA